MIQISGKVIHGDNYGKTLGFPTANLDRKQYVREKLKIKFGIWSGWATIMDSQTLQYRAAIVVGPYDKYKLPKIEAHLLDFRGSLYGKKIRIILYKYIRTFKKFKDEDSLKRQIQKDIMKINSIHNKL